MLGWSAGRLAITTLAEGRFDISSLRAIELLGPHAGAHIALPDYRQDAAGLHLVLPNRAPFTAPAYVTRLIFDGPIPVTGSNP